MRPPHVAVIGPLRGEGSTLGRQMSRAGVYFYQMPDLYTACDLDRFRSIVVDRGAFDRNSADLRAYFGKLTEFVDKGGTLVLLPQDRAAEMASLLPPGLRFGSGSNGQPRVITGGEWEEIQTGRMRFLEAAIGKGRVLYCDDSIPAEALL